MLKKYLCAKVAKYAIQSNPLLTQIQETHRTSKKSEAKEVIRK